MERGRLFKQLLDSRRHGGAVGAVTYETQEDMKEWDKKSVVEMLPHLKSAVITRDYGEGNGIFVDSDIVTVL